LKQKGAYRILCLGESTTAGLGDSAYPLLLEEILNAKNIGIKFSVINKGVRGTHCLDIYSSLNDNLDLYKPDMVIVMMGINEGGTHMPKELAVPSRQSLLKKLKIYKLGQYILMHLSARAKEFTSAWSNWHAYGSVKVNKKYGNDAFDSQSSHGADINCKMTIGKLNRVLQVQPDDDQLYVSLGWAYKTCGEGEPAEQTFQKALAINSRNYDAHFALGGYYRELPDYDKSISEYKKAIEVSPNKGPAYAGLGWDYLERAAGAGPDRLEYLAMAQEVFRKMAGINPKDKVAYLGLAESYRVADDFPKAQEMLLRVLAIDPENKPAYRNLISLCYQFDRDDLVRRYRQQYGDAMSTLFQPEVGEYYRRIHRMLSQKGIKLVCMQYPTLSIDTVKHYFEHDNQNIIFIENKDNFSAALGDGKVSDYFRDMFGGTFGHCTPRGNKLLAENVANIILKDVFGK